MSDRITLSNAEGTLGVVYCEEGASFGPIPLEDEANCAIYDRLIAAGVKPEPYAPPVEIRRVSGLNLIKAMTDDQAAKAKIRDLLRLAADASVLETSAVLARIVKAAEMDGKAWFDAAMSQS